ncbi:hypothetical protein HK097_004406, partial [Rhizophlyctis rosea]
MSNAKPFTEEDREAEMAQSLTQAPLQPVTYDAWELAIKPAGLTKEAGRLLIAGVRIIPSGVLLTFESLPEALPSSDTLYSLLCRAICFPMSRKTPGRPKYLHLFAHKDVAGLSDTIKDLSNMLQEKLSISCEVKDYPATMENQPPAKPVQSEPSTFACATCRKGLAPAAVSRCSSCRAANYCSRQCQSDDWNQHKKFCKLLKSDMGQSLADDLKEFGIEGVESLLSTTPDLQAYLTSTKLLNLGLWRLEFILNTFDLGSRMDGLLRDRINPTLGFLPPLTRPSATLPPNTGYDSTPKAISSYPTYHRALNLPPTFPSPLLLSNSLTVFHTLSHILSQKSPSSDASPLSISPGSHITIHIVEPTQSEIELAPLYEILLPLLRGITIDIFFIGPEIIVVPLAAPTDNDIQPPLDAPKILGKKEYSIEYKSEENASCVRLHFARAAYDQFPRSAYPPNVVFIQNGARKLFGGEEQQTKSQVVDA